MPDDTGSVDDLFDLAYEELRRIASGVRRSHASATLNPTALVHEAWIKLAGSSSPAPESRRHLRRVAARAMRQVLVDAARRRGAEKRGAGAIRVTFEESLEPGKDGTVASAEEVLALDRALGELARIAPRQAAMVEGRFFGGLDVAETADLLGISEATVMRDWRAARAWLGRRLRGEAAV